MAVTQVSAEEWRAQNGVFLALWTDQTHAYALYAPDRLVAVPLQAGAYPALPHPAASWFQRLAKDLHGHVATGFEAPYPAIAQFREADGRAPWPSFTGPEDEGVNQLALGPVYGILNEPAHFRVFVRGEQIMQLQTRLGYAHRGVLGLMLGKSPRQAARYAARLVGDATVAHALAFARAAEAALGVDAPARARGLREIMLGLEQIAVQCGVLAAMAAALGSALLQSRAAVLRDYICAAAQAAFGHRLMMDLVVPGGVAVDMAESGAAVIQDALGAVEAELPDLQRGFGAPGMRELMSGVGDVSPALAARYAVPAGDVAARLHARLEAVAESLVQVRTVVASLEPGAVGLVLPALTGMGLGCAQSSRGAVWSWLKLDNGQIQGAFMVDPSCQIWPVLEMVSMNQNLVNFPLIAASFNASCAAVDM